MKEGSSGNSAGNGAAPAGTTRLELRDRHLIGVIGDQDTVTGMLLAGVGNIDGRGKRNYYIVDGRTAPEAVEEAFKDLTGRRDVAILLITQAVADGIRPLMDEYAQMLPAIVEIPSKDHPYDPAKDSVMKQVNRLFEA